MFWQKDAETMPRAEIRALQLKKLQHTVKWSYDRVPYYHKIMEESGVTPDQIKSLDRCSPPTFYHKSGSAGQLSFWLICRAEKEDCRDPCIFRHNRKADCGRLYPA